MRFSIRQSYLFLAGVLLLGLSLAGCSGFGFSTAHIADDMQLKVGINALSTTYLADYVAQDKGYFKAQGLTISPIPFHVIGTSANMTEAVRTGAIDLAIGGIVSDVFALSRVDADLKIIGEIQNAYSADVIAGNPLIQQTHLTESSPLADKVRALVGKKIGVVSVTGGTGAFMIYLFRQYGLDINKDATLVPVGSTATAALAALKSGRVDALCFFPPVGFEVEGLGLGKMWISPFKHDVPQMIGQLNGVFYGKQSLIAAKPRTIKALIRAIAMALTFIQSHPTEAAAILQKYTHLDKKTTAATVAVLASSYPSTPVVSQQAYNVAASFDLNAGLISVAPLYQTLVDTDVVNQALQGFTPSV